MGAASNTLCLDRLDAFLQRYTPDTGNDRFFWIVTSPARCHDLDYFLASTDPYQTMIDSLTASLQRANEIALQHDIKIKLIGGLCDLHELDIVDYSNLEIVVESWGRLLDPSYNQSRIEPYFWTQLGEKIDPDDTTMKEQWLSKADESVRKLHSWESMKELYFSADGSHPDRHAHLVLRNYLFPEWKHKY